MIDSNMSDGAVVFVWLLGVCIVFLLPVLIAMAAHKALNEHKKDNTDNTEKEEPKQNVQPPDEPKGKKPYREDRSYGDEQRKKQEARQKIIAEKEKLNKYVVFDLETTGLNPQYDYITEIGAVLVENSEIVDTFERLVRPKKKIPDKVAELTGITNEMVAEAKSINLVLPQFLEFIGNNVLVGHNVDFDSKFISAACQRFNLPYKNKVCDTLELSSRTLPDLEDHKLGTVCRELGITNESAHRASSDAAATMQVFEALRSRAVPKIKAHPRFTLNRNSYNVKYTGKTKAVQELQELLSEIIDDNILTDEEVMRLKDWLEDNDQYCGEYPFDKIRKTIENALEDGILEQIELDEMLELFTELCKPKFDKNVSSDELINLVGKTLVFTGECKLGDFTEIKPIYENMGAVVRQSVSGKTDYLVIGSYGSPDWSYENYGSDVMKAWELQEAGKKVKIVNEEDFIPLIYSE